MARRRDSSAFGTVQGPEALRAEAGAGGLDGNSAVRESAAVQLRKISVWMSAYRSEDVAAVCNGWPIPKSSPSVATAVPVPSQASSTATTPSLALPITFANGTCTSPLAETFPIGYAFTASELQLELARKCPGAAVTTDGRINVLWMDKSYTVELASRKEPSGLQIYEVRALRER